MTICTIYIISCRNNYIDDDMIYDELLLKYGHLSP